MPGEPPEDGEMIEMTLSSSNFEPWRSEAEHATSRSRRLPTILTFTRGWGRNIFCFFQTAETGNGTPNSGVKGSGANHYPRAPALEQQLDDDTAGLVMDIYDPVGKTVRKHIC